MTSIWSDTSSLPQFPRLDGDHSADVLIIGGGMAGILCAWKLKKAGVNCCLVEADQIGRGITEFTTAKITLLHGLIYHKLIRKYGVEKARMYLDANQNALNDYRNLCNSIDCDWQEQDAYTYSLHDPKLIEQELDALEKLHCPASFAEALPLPFSVAGSVRLPGQAQFHPLKFLASISRDLPIYEHTQVTELAPHVAKTDRGTIRADKMIVATHFPLLNKHGSYFLKLYQHRSYVLALKDAPVLDGMYVDQDKKGLSFRSYGDHLLLGGGSHRTGKTGGNWAELEQFASSHYPKAHIVSQWATQDCMTLDGIPYIGPYSRHTDGLFAATGFNKWGMTSSMVAANILTDLVLEKKNAFAPVFSPSRSMLHSQLLFNGLESTKNLLTPTVPRCPHMGCALKWNPQEHTWDCPCHGSRFTKEGKLINNPATGGLKK